MEEIIRKAKYCYEKSRGKPGYHKKWKDKNNEKYNQRKKGFKPSNFRNQQKQPSQDVGKLARVMGENPRDPQQHQESLQCWKCGGPDMRRNFPREIGNVRPDYNIQETETVG